MTLSADGQAIALVCSPLALGGQRSIKPLTQREWQHLRSALAHSSSLASPGELLGREPAELRSELELPQELAERITLLLSRGGQLALELERLAGRGIWVLTRAEERYPRRLRELLGAQSPPLLYGAGPHSAFDVPALAVVGSRDADPEALEFARGLGHQCARQDVALISGAARGVDREAMAGAVEAGGITLGVTVEPLERLVRQPALRAAIGEELMTLLTPFPPSARWHAGNAMRRNRLVYAMSQAAVVASATANGGGTWSGAVENLKHGWVPLFVRGDADEGSRELAKVGARALPPGPAEAIDVQELFGWRTLKLAPPPEILSSSPPEASATETSPAGVPADEGELDAFTVVWTTLLADYLREPRSEADVARTLQLQPTQARVWLKRAAKDGLATVKKRPKKTFVLSESGSQQLSLDGESH